MQSQQSLNIGNKLMAEFKPRNAELEKYKKQIIEKEAALEKEAPNLSQREYVTRRQEIDYQKIDLDRKKARQHEDFVMRKQEEINNFQNSVNAAVTSVGQSEGYDLILYNTGGYIGPRVDITDKVLKLLK
jgi:outer membrane protein